MSVHISYSHLPRLEADKKAIEDSKRWLKSFFDDGESVWEQILVLCGQVDQRGTNDAFQSLNIDLDFVGIRDYPVHAIGRKYCRKAYAAWMKQVGELDSDGFLIKKEEVSSNGT